MLNAELISEKTQTSQLSGGLTKQTCSLRNPIGLSRPDLSAQTRPSDSVTPLEPPHPPSQVSFFFKRPVEAFLCCQVPLPDLGGSSGRPDRLFGAWGFGVS